MFRLVRLSINWNFKILKESSRFQKLKEEAEFKNIKMRIRNLKNHDYSFRSDRNPDYAVVLKNRNIEYYYDEEIVKQVYCKKTYFKIKEMLKSG